MIDSIKITSLTNIGANLSYTSIFPVVNITGTPITNKANLQIIGNYILSQAGGANMVQAAQATLAQSVVNAAQPNITSVGTLSISTLKISGGVSGYILRTDGAGNLTWIASTATVSGSNTQIQFNNAGSFGSSANLTYNNTTGIFTAPFVAGNGNGLSNIQGANVSGFVANANIANTAFAVAAANVSGLGNIATINLTGSNANVLYGNGVFAAIAGGANTGNITFVNTTISAPNDDDIVVQAMDSDGIVSSSLELSPGDTTRLEQWSSQQSDTFTTADWTTGVYINQGGQGAIQFTGAANIIAFVNSLDGVGHIYYSVNGGPQLVYDGTSDGGGNITFYTPTLPATDPTVVTSFEYFYSYNSGFEIVSGEGTEVNIYGGYADINLRTTGQQDINLDSSGDVILTANSTVNWTFASTGNLTLPGNTFAVNYANGTQVSIGGGGANTGNVTFSDQIVLGTGSNDGSGGLYLAPGSNSIANSALQYLRVRGGDVVTHIHLDTGNNAFYDQYFGNDAKYVKLEAGDAGNVVIGTDDANGNQYSWSFTSDGNLILADGNSIITSIANSSLDPNNANVSTMVFTPDQNYTSQALVIDPTGPSHIHLRAPGANIDEPDANIFLGGEESSFEVGYYNGAAPNLFIHSNNNTWTFDNGGTLLFPRDTDPNTADPILAIVGGANPSISAIDASLAGPANLGISALTTIFSGVSGDEIKIYPDDGEISSTANLQIWANSGGNTEYSWTFGTDGSLTLPIGVSIDYNENVQYPKIIADSGKLFSVQGQGNTGSAALAWTIDPNAASQYAAVAVTRAGGDDLAKVVLQAQSNSGDVATAKTWQFSETGNLTLPLGSIVYETNIPDQSLSGSAIALKPIGGTTANQQLLIYPTAADGDHIHMTSGNLYTTELFLGSDNFYVKLANTGNVVINSNNGNSNTAMWTFDTAGNLTAPGVVDATGFTGDGSTLSNVATKVTSSWTLASGNNTVSISVPGSGTYTIWINGNIPNGIVTYIATAVVTNTNVPVLGDQYGWYYEVGNALVLTSIPNQFVGTAGAISNVNTYLGNTANVFTFGITNNSGNAAVVNYGYTKL